MNLLQRLTAGEERADPSLSFDQWMSFFTYSGSAYQLVNQTLLNPREEISGDYAGLVRSAYKQNGVVFACILVRMLLFKEARFQFRQRVGGRGGNLFGTQDLQVLERPWAGGTTADLLARMELDASLAGNSFTARLRGQDRLMRLRPDWTSIVLGSQTDAEHPNEAPDAEVVGYIYEPGGRGSGKKATYFDRSEVAHYAPIPDPMFLYRGMSWLTPIVQEISADSAATKHKRKFFENGATPNLVVKTPLSDPTKFAMWVELMREKTEGLENAYKTLYLGAGADATVVGADLRQIEFKVTQGAGETRIAAAAGVPPVIVGLSEGLQAATYSNYGQARRRFADGTMHPLWRDAAGSLQTIVPPPSGAELWYDDHDIPFLRDDEKDVAEIANAKATAMRTLVDGGFEPASVVDAVESGDLTRLKHTGLLSVQLQAPGAGKPPASTNGRALALAAATEE